MTPTQADLDELLERQSGLLSRRQAMDSGLTRGAIEHRLRQGGPWQVVLPSVYATFTGRLTTHQRMISALLYGGDSSVLGGATACALYALRQLPHTRHIHLLLPHALHPSSRDFVRVRRTITMPPPVFLDELRAAPIERAVVDACRGLPDLNAVRALVAESVQRRLTRVPALQAELSLGGSAGSALTRRALCEVSDGARSVAEAIGRNLILRSDLPAPLWNQDLFTAHGEWLCCADAWWPEAGVVLEIDSREWHLLPEHWAATMRRHALMTSHGLLVVHARPRQFDTEPDAVLATLERTIAAGMARPTPAITAVPPVGWLRTA
ncbi:MAG: hypothetical protein M3O55_02265 [Actinomycetota bacterium]|nr:hypothetical protein [Actinomycetota bacterium]